MTSVLALLATCGSANPPFLPCGHRLHSRPQILWAAHGARFSFPMLSNAMLRMLAILAVLSVLAGCQTMLENPAGGGVLLRGTAKQQQDWALVFDPYPDQDAGPAIVGGRPLSYQKELPEPIRATFYAERRNPALRSVRAGQPVRVASPPPDRRWGTTGAVAELPRQL